MLNNKKVWKSMRKGTKSLESMLSVEKVWVSKRNTNMLRFEQNQPVLVS